MYLLKYAQDADRIILSFLRGSQRVCDPKQIHRKES